MSTMGANGRAWYRGRGRVIRNPFDPVEVIEHLEYCRECKMDVDITVEVGNADGIDVYRKRCNRCGGVMQHGIGKRHVTSDNKKPLPPKALEFIRQRGKDRR